MGISAHGLSIETEAGRLDRRQVRFFTPSALSGGLLQPFFPWVRQPYPSWPLSGNLDQRPHHPTEWPHPTERTRPRTEWPCSSTERLGRAEIYQLLTAVLAEADELLAGLAHVDALDLLLDGGHDEAGLHQVGRLEFQPEDLVVFLPGRPAGQLGGKGGKLGGEGGQRRRLQVVGQLLWNRDTRRGQLKNEAAG